MRRLFRFHQLQYSVDLPCTATCIHRCMSFGLHAVCQTCLPQTAHLSTTRFRSLRCLSRLRRVRNVSLHSLLHVFELLFRWNVLSHMMHLTSCAGYSRCAMQSLLHVIWLPVLFVECLATYGTVIDLCLDRPLLLAFITACYLPGVFPSERFVTCYAL